MREAAEREVDAEVEGEPGGVCGWRGGVGRAEGRGEDGAERVDGDAGGGEDPRGAPGGVEARALDEERGGEREDRQADGETPDVDDVAPGEWEDRAAGEVEHGQAAERREYGVVAIPRCSPLHCVSSAPAPQSPRARVLARTLLREGVFAAWTNHRAARHGPAGGGAAPTTRGRPEGRPLSTAGEGLETPAKRGALLDWWLSERSRRRFRSA